MVHFRVDKTWSGQDLADTEAATLRLVALAEGLEIQVEAPWHGDPPPAAPPGPVWGLWEYEVVELFVLGSDGTYLEVELGPHGHHLVLQLASRREVSARELPLSFTATRAGGRWGGRAVIPWSYLPPAPHRANAYAIHGSGGARRYLAAHAVPGPAPDFHRLEFFPPVLLPVLSPASEA